MTFDNQGHPKLKTQKKDFDVPLPDDGVPQNSVRGEALA